MIISQDTTPTWLTITSLCIRTLSNPQASGDEQSDALKQLLHIARIADKACAVWANKAAAQATAADKVSNA